MVAAAIVRRRRLLVAWRRGRRGRPGGAELPGGRIEPGESPVQALVRELREELGVEARIGSWLGRSRLPLPRGELVLDAWGARIRRGVPECRVHEALSWAAEGELPGLPWLPADRALLPALAHELRSTPAPRIPRSALLVAADWSAAPRRRAAWLADPAPPSPRLAPLATPGEGELELGSLLRASREAGGSRPVLIGIDAVLGVPILWADSAGVRRFAEALELLAARGALEGELAPGSRFDPFRPFFRVPRGRGALSSLVRAAGGPGLFRRQVEQGLPASSCFAAGGIPGAVGGATRALWRELARYGGLGPADGRAPTGAPFRIWPFAGPLPRILRNGATVLGEIYPRALGGLALRAGSGSRVGAREPLSALGKRSPAGREKALRRLQRAGWIRRHGVALGGLDAAARSEDAFDALLGAAGLLRLALEGHPATGAPVDPVLEGGILGLAARCGP